MGDQLVSSSQFASVGAPKQEKQRTMDARIAAIIPG